MKNKKAKPEYFDDIRYDAQKRWGQLEADPFLAGPWRQLFRQVQSPRHVLSELLQNADDVGATWASVAISDEQFSFMHNGKDFDKTSFHSLCQFGISNKRHLHTIGFRGMGFKSTFSLGSKVEVITPTLSVAFNKKRFTEPIWIGDDKEISNNTLIRIDIDATEKIKVVKENINSWIKNPVPILFFRNIRSLDLQGEIITKEVIGVGPIPNSNWVKINSQEELILLHIISGGEQFPDEAINEIRDERDEPDFDLPASKIEIIIGVPDKQSVYVVLPTQISLDLPFSFNAPFLQDPARSGIKDVETSPTNQWLLTRIAKLVAVSMKHWLLDKSLSQDERIDGYKFLPTPEISGNSNEAYIKRIFVEEINEFFSHGEILLTNDGKVVSKTDCLSIPNELINVWNDQDAINIFGDEEKYIISPAISQDLRQLLEQWDWITILSPISILIQLSQEPYPPRPSEEILVSYLWDYVNTHHTWRFEWDYGIEKENLAIIPVRNKKLLFPRDSVYVLRRKGKKISQSNWNFISGQVPVVNSKWIRFINNIRELTFNEDDEDKGCLLSTLDLFDYLDLNKGISIESLIKHAANSIFDNPNPGKKGIRLTHIVARLNLTVPAEFFYLCLDGNWRQIDRSILFIKSKGIKKLFPRDWVKKHHINDNEYKIFTDGFNAREWGKWLSSTKSGLHQFPIPTERTHYYYAADDFEDFCYKRDGVTPKTYPLKVGNFKIFDYDFDLELWDHWETLALKDSMLWSSLIQNILFNWKNKWKSINLIKAFMLGTTKEYRLSDCIVHAAWLNKLSSHACILDSTSIPSFPNTLYRLTPDTAPLKGIETFIHPDIDQPQNSDLLDLLGVRSTPVNIIQLIDRLRDVSIKKSSLKKEVINLYIAIDGIVNQQSKSEVLEIKRIFELEDLILTEDGSWASSVKVFRKNEENLPDVNILMKEVSYLDLWDKLNIQIRPQIEYIVEWLNQLQSRIEVSSTDLSRIKSFQRREPSLIWSQCAHWLNIEGEWTPKKDLIYLSKLPRENKYLFDWIKRTIADLSMLDDECDESAIFNNIIPIEQKISYKITNIELLTDLESSPTWMTAIAENLLCMEFPQEALSGISKKMWEEKKENVSKRLLNTRWHNTKILEVTPYIDDNPAGSVIPKKAFWIGLDMYVLSDGTIHYRELVQTINAHFSLAIIQQSVSDCIYRDTNWIDAYFKEYFLVNETQLTNLRKKSSETREIDYESYSDYQFQKDPIDHIQDSEISHTEEVHETRSRISSDKNNTMHHKLEISYARKSFRQPRLIGQSDPEVEIVAMDAIKDKESVLGFIPEDVSEYNRGWDIESRDPKNKITRFVEVKGRFEGSSSVIVSRNEILQGLKKAEDYYLAIVEVIDDGENLIAKNIFYIKNPFFNKPDKAATHVIYDWKKMLLILNTD